MASIRKREWGNYQVRYRDTAGREHARAFKKKTHADRFKHEVEHDLDRGDWVDPRAGEVTLTTWVDEAWELGQPVRQRTAADRKSRMDKHVLPVFGETPLVRLDAAEVQKWVNSLTDAGYAPATVKKIFETLSAPLRIAVEYGRLAHSPCGKIRLPADRHIEMRFLLPEEVARLARAITPHFGSLVLFAAETGLRIGEIAGLQGGDYQPGTHTIDVKRQLLKDTTPPTYGDPKTRAGIRSLTLSPPLAARIQALGVVADAPMFTSVNEGLLDVPNFRSRHFYPAVQTAGLGHVRIHDLRHTAISSWINQGATIKAVTARAGIASVATAFDRYGHLYPNEDHQLADLLAHTGVYEESSVSSFDSSRNR